MPELIPKETTTHPLTPPLSPHLSAADPIMVTKSEINKKAEEARLARQLPPKPGDHVNLKELNDWFKLLTPQMTGDNRIFVYVYRLDPPIIRQKVDPTAPNNIDVIADIIPGIGIKEQSIIDRHGGGKYKLVVKDTDKDTIGGFFDAKVIINQVDHPPKLDLREVDWDNPYARGYKAYCRANRLIDENNMPITPESQKKADATESSNATIAAMKLVMDYTSQLNDKQQAELKKRMGGEDSINKTFNDIILEKMKQDDPNKQLVALTTILTAMKSMQPEVKPDNTLSTILPIFMQMMTQMNESSNKQFQMMMEMVKIKNEANGGTDKGSVITEVKELFNLFQDMNGNGGARKTTAEVIGGIVESNLTPVLQIISQVVAMKATSMGVNGVPGATHIPPTTTQGSPTSPVSPPPGGSAPPPGAGLPSPSEAAQIITQFGPIIINKLVGEGWEFGAWVSEGFGDQTAISIARYGVDQLLAAAKSVPQFWSQVERTYGEAYMRKWLTSFVNYKDEMNKMDDDDEEVVMK